MKTVLRWMQVMMLPAWALSLAGCQDDPFCYDCGPGGAKTSPGVGGGDGSNTLLPSFSVTVPPLNTELIPTCGDTTTRENCGACGNRCDRAGANASCDKVDGKYTCVYSCAPGLSDINLDLNGKTSDGCEYACVPNGSEKCDDIDNDCNGKVDDGLANDTDPNNCGACNVRCAYKNASAQCVAGQCQLGACAASFIDLDHDPKNGCEFQCTVTNGGVEKCDELDNDCNGQVDDMPSEALSTDLRNCGVCGHECKGEATNATAACVAGKCTIQKCEPRYFDKDQDPHTGCEELCTCPLPPFTEGGCNLQGNCIVPSCSADYHDLNKDLGTPGSNGCEYNCHLDPDPAKQVELCDGVDNDCNGAVDDNASVSSDPLNCGACGTSCRGVYPNTEPSCNLGACVVKCLPGFFDKNQADGNKDGCEFSCGSCQFPNGQADAVSCEADGACHLGSCQADHWNLNGDPADACEYSCRVTAAGGQDAGKTLPEAQCNGVDEDCDGLVDEGFNLQNDANNCGVCGMSCLQLYPNGIGACVAGGCKPSGCAAGFVDTDKKLENGCECQIQNGGVEACNGIDDDCDGLVDDGATVPTSACTAYQSGTCGGKAGCVGGDPVCEIPTSPEICDGIDNDCDNAVDEDPTTLPGVGQLCGNAPEVGTCHRGRQVCAGGALVCQDYVLPVAEECNGKDDDCDGQIDESTPQNPLPGIDQPCGSGVGDGIGICHRGVYSACVAGELRCTGEVLPGTVAEICNGKDDDCDGQTDETSAQNPLPGLGTPCGAVQNVGECRQGTYSACSAGALVCTGLVAPSPEACDGKDNDCDGIVDEDITNMPSACSAYSNANCGGTTRCAAGRPECVYVHTQEVCDGKDNDCDELVDENTNEEPLPGLGELCGTAPQKGNCRLGTYSSCSGGTLLCTGEVKPAASESCDGQDNDCDGLVDEAPVTVDSQCTAYQTANCSCTTSCVNGAAVARVITSQEVCDGKDNDCDSQVDELPLAELGQPCGSSTIPKVGECHLGTYTSCAGGALQCTGTQGPIAEVCDGKDNDCNGKVDDDLTHSADIHNTGEACPPKDKTLATVYGVCKSGTWACTQYYNSGALAGRWDCQNAVNPGVEVCDKQPAPATPLDEDCDSTKNEGCLTPAATSTRMDTGGGTVTASAQGQHSTFQLHTASAGETYGAVYSDLRNHTKLSSGTDYAQTRLFGRFSVDGGATWQAELSMAPADSKIDAGSVEPNLAIGANRAYVAFSAFATRSETGRVRRVFVASADRGTSAPNYANWGNLVRLDRAESAGSTVDVSIDFYRPQVVLAVAGANVAQDRVAVVWSAIKETPNGNLPPTAHRNIYLSYSTNGGSAWSAPLQVNSVVDGAQLPAITTDSKGMVSVAWRQTTLVNAISSERVWVRRINLAAASPALGTAIAVEPEVQGKSGDDVAIAADTVGNVHVVWSDLDNKSIRVATGEACGVGFTDADCKASFDATAAAEISPDGQPLGLRGEAARPQIAVKDGVAAVAWEDQRSGYSDIRVNRAAQSTNWAWGTKSQRADADVPGAAMSSNPRIIFGDGGRVVVAWEDTRDDADLTDGITTSIYANNSIDDGVTFFSGSTAYALRIDSTTTTATSLTPFVLSNPARTTSAVTSVVWLDYAATNGTNGANGDIWVRQLTQ